MKYSSGSAWEDKIGYSRAIRRGNVIEVSGTTSTEAGKPVHLGDPYQQTVQILTIIKTAIEALGGQMSDVVRTRIFVQNISHWQEVGRAHSTYFGEIKPATSIVEISALVDSDLLVEIEATAIIEG